MNTKDLMTYGGVGAAGVGVYLAYKSSKIREAAKTAGDVGKADADEKCRKLNMAAIVLIGGGVASAYYANFYQPALLKA